MQKITIRVTDVEKMMSHAQHEYPYEACGLIGGRKEMALQVIPVRNVSPTPEARFVMDQREMVNAILSFEKAKQEVVGIYHSHPHEPAIPSLADITEATWPDVAYLIIGLPTSTTPDLRAWSIRRGKVAPVEIDFIDE